ncbi:MAG: phthiocerol/phthiodiolone dimycocerosyl transferase family protein, partial [Thermoguttaceae bacterium]
MLPLEIQAGAIIVRNMHHATRLTPFEEMMYCADSPAYPMTFFCRLRFAGTLDIDRLTQIVQNAAAKQPLFTSTVELVTSSRVEYYVWKTSDRRVAVTLHNATDPNTAPHTPHLDLTQEIGLRLFVTERHLDCGNVTELLFQVHHACCDGIRFADFVDGVLQNYATSSVDVATIPPATVPRGKNAATPWWAWLLIPCTLLVRTVLVIRLAFLYWRHAAPLVATPPQLDAPQPHETFPSLFIRQLDRDATQRILEAAKRENVTFNDMLLTAAFRAIEMFRHVDANDKRPLRLSIPVNLQTKDAARTEAANVVSMMFIDRRLTATTSPQRLLASVHRAMIWAKRFDAATLLAGLRLLKLFPRLLPHVVRNRHRLWATVVVSNLGRLFSQRGEMTVGDAI